VELFEARKQREAALASAQRAEATKDFLELVLSEFQSRGEVLTTRRLLERSSKLLKAQYADRPDFVSEMLIELATSYNDLLDINTARRLLTDARGIAHAQSNNRLLASAECALATLEVHNEAPDAGKEHLDLGSQALRTVPADDATVRTTCMGAQAALVDVRGDRARAIEIERQARKMLEDAGAIRGVAYSEALSDLAGYLTEDGRVAEALPVLQLSMSNHEANGRRGTRMELIAEQNVSVALYRLGEVSAAYEIQTRLFARMMQLKNPGDMDFANVVGTATHANRLRIRVPAQEMLGEAVARAEQEGDLQGFDYASVELARFRLQTGAPRSEVEAPLEHLEAAHAGKRIPLGLRLLVLSESVRAELDLRDTRFANADDRARKLLTTLDEAKFIRPQSNYMAYLLEARTALSVGDAARAVNDARAALRIVEPIARGTETSADVGEALSLLARGLVAQGKVREARPLLERAVKSLTRGYSTDHPATADAARLLEESSLSAEG
jgi:tetratricopeptide (TPR) repeat protein